MFPISLYLHTARHLKLRQVFYRACYFARKRFATMGSPHISETPKTRQLQIMQPIARLRSLDGTTFTFLNRAQAFREKIDWNFSEYGKLWCYNLNYFDFLNQEGMDRKEGLRLIHDFIGHTGACGTGLDPYPISLRIINWIKFICMHGICDELIDKSLFLQARLLERNLEYHLLGNHLLENGFALLFAAECFQDEQLRSRAKSILRHELYEQVLNDGGHFERSPMYHQIILDRILDCINLLKNNGCRGDNILSQLVEKASVMLGWLRQMTFENGNIPLVNDAAFDIAPTTAELFAYAARLDVTETVLPLKESGYRKISRNGHELLLDVGNIGPDYIPGHAHSDTFSFVLYRDGKPFIVDTGTSTYEACERRLSERRTASHNTVQIDGLEQSEVWGSFRVARRAYVRDLAETENMVSAWHTGYERIGARHRRVFYSDEQAIVIRDTVDSNKQHVCRAYLHFHPGVEVTSEQDSVVADGASITFAGASEVTIEEYLYAPRFNVLVPGKMIVVTFDRSMTTAIAL